MQSKTANIIGGKTARACDSCLRKRARWFCAADDAFLCQTCDSSVHSANQLASRHERVRIETASWKTNNNNNNNNKFIIKLEDHEINSWDHGFTKKPRTPRSRCLQQKRKPVAVADLVPEISYEGENDEERELMLYRVPVFDPFANEVPFGIDDIIKDTDYVDFDVVTGIEIPEFIPSDDIELEELNSLLGIGETLDNNDCFEDNILKIEKENQDYEGVMDTAVSESFNWDFDYSKSLIVVGEDEDQPTGGDIENREKEKRKIKLKINIESIIAAWDSQGSPWTNGIKPEFNSDDCWPHFMETGNGINKENLGRSGSGSENRGSWDKEREARVLRYREKRRKRLFAKKIRYEVRKLNAEKRPRLKGRFVKRTSSFPP